MKSKRIFAWLLIACLVLTSACSGKGESSTAAGSSSEAEAAPAKDTVTVTDMAGREVTVTLPVERVAALTASDCEILCALGAGDSLVARGEYCDYPEQALSAPVVQSGSETNIEQIIALAPQVVLMNKMAQPKQDVETLEKAGIAVIVSDAVDIAGVYSSISIIGAAIGRDAQADALIAEMQDKFATVTAQDTGKTIFFEVSPLEYGLWTAGSGTFMDELATMLGLKNAFGDIEGWAEISEEQVIERNPDYIVTITIYFGEGPTPTEEIMARSGWQQVKAVQTGSVFQIDGDLISRPTPRLADAAGALYELIYEKANEQAA